MDHKNFKVDFLGIGAAKSGTTWLADVLREHPDIFIPKEKELFYFNKYLAEYELMDNYRYGKAIDWYHAFFENANEKMVKGEMSNPYLWNENAVEDIYQYNPNIKLLAVLRNPIKRAYSNYLYDKHRHYTAPQTFELALKDRSFYLTKGLYYENLKSYFDRFPKEQIKVLLFDDLKKDNKVFLKEIYDFLGVKTYYPASIDEKSNVTKEPRSKALNKFIDGFRFYIKKHDLQFILPVLKKTGITPVAEYIRDKVNRKAVKGKEPLPTHLKKQLENYYAKDIDQLEKLLEKDLSAWKA